MYNRTYGMISVTASKLRANIYRILDEILETGVAVEIVRRGRKLRIIPMDEGPSNKLDKLVERADVIRCDPEDIVHVDWSKEWRHGPT